MKKPVTPAPIKTNKNNKIDSLSARIPAPHVQVPLDLSIEIEKHVDGIEMGILENGIPYLTQNGLAAIAGTARATIFEITKEWEEKFNDPILPNGRLSFFKDYLFANEYKEQRLFFEVPKNGSLHYAYPDIVCMAVLEFFAFEAQRTNKTALKNYRNLSRLGLHTFIYKALQYAPPDKWKYFNDRVSILRDSSPDNHFIVFNETTGLIVDLIKANLTVNDKTIPDISIGTMWSKLWVSGSLGQEFGERMKYEHHYPSYYPQSASNPQTPWAYPDTALPLFRRWFKYEYLPTKFPKYILTKANVLKGGKPEAKQIATLYEQKLLSSS